MKGEFNNGDRHEPASTNNFSKLHHHHHPFSHHFNLYNSSDPQPSDDDVATSRTSTAAAAPFISSTHTPDGSTVEVPRRKRGRPPGSKNKPKLQQPAAGEPQPGGSDMSPYILEVAPGNDVVEAVSRFCHRRKGTGLCILSASGAIANLTLRQPAAVSASSPPPTVTFHGRFEILSIAATVLPQTQPNQIPNAFSISLAGPQGQVVGGTVVGPLVTAGPVFIVAVLLDNPSHHKLPLPPPDHEDDDDDEEDEECNWNKSASESQSLGSGGGVDSGNTPPQPQSEVVGRSMYSHMGSDVIWPRPPPPSRHY